ncbi:hypothetical protein NESM_000716700 [Novymonas esmeraldas]|uniref:RanBP2-type domain-containing protein n=1 Tax=Novymonas esmeraldas TaxID=1808958 RepID=A0AAW0EX45_9TRYP
MAGSRGALVGRKTAPPLDGRRSRRSPRRRRRSSGSRSRSYSSSSSSSSGSSSTSRSTSRSSSRSSSYDSLSYSYDSSRSLSTSPSRSSSASSRVSEERPRRGQRRLRSRSPSADEVQRRPRGESVLGSGYTTAPDSAALPPYSHDHHQSSSAPVLPAVLGDAVLAAAAVPPLGSVLGASETPTEDWPCGVCSNINSQQRTSCYRCGCHYAESLLAMPSYEVCLTHLPASCTPAAVEAAVRRTAPLCAVHHVGVDAASGVTYIQFASVAEATKCLVQSHCELQLAHGDGGDDDGGDGVRARLSFSLNPHPLQEREVAEAAVARAAAEAAAQKREAALLEAGVPQHLWPHEWRVPPPFPTAAKHRGYLQSMSAHWDHLSDEQRCFYDAEVKKALLGTAVAPATGGGAAPATAPATGGASPSVGADGGVAKTSHALDGLKKRLAERKSAMKKADGADVAKSATATVAGAPQARDGGGASGLAVTLRGTGGGSPATPSRVPADVVLWDGFPVPLQFRSLEDAPRTIELPRVPMAVCERLLPPALLQVARMQFKAIR